MKCELWRNANFMKDQLKHSHSSLMNFAIISRGAEMGGVNRDWTCGLFLEPDSIALVLVFLEIANEVCLAKGAC